MTTPTKATTKATTKAPDHLSERARGLWSSVLGLYSLDPHEVEMLRRMCEASDRADTAARIVERDGVTTTTRLGEVKAHPAVAIERDARRAVVQCAQALGLPSTAPPPPKPRDGRRAP